MPSYRGDYGLKEMWVGWTTRRMNEKPAEPKTASKDWVAQLWDEWKTQAVAKNEAPKSLPEIPHIAGGQTVRELGRPLVWKPADAGVGADTVARDAAGSVGGAEEG